MKNAALKRLNPFDLENLRTDLAVKRDYKGFKETYALRLPEIKASNTNYFWSKKFKSPEYFNDLDSMTKEKINSIINSLPVHRSKILDLGIGQGYLEQRLVELGIEHDIYGIDISKTSISRSRKNFKGVFKQGDILKVDDYFKSNTFDVIVAIEVIEHIPPRKIFGLYDKIHKLLHKNGLFIVSTPLNEGLCYMDDNPSAHVREYTIAILNCEFRLARFKILKTKSFFAFNKLYMLKKLVSLFVTWRWRPNNVMLVARRV